MYVGLQITYVVEGDGDQVSLWQRILVDVWEQSLRQHGPTRYGDAWALNRVREHHSNPELKARIIDIDRVD